MLGGLPDKMDGGLLGIPAKPNVESGMIPNGIAG